MPACAYQIIPRKSPAMKHPRCLYNSSHQFSTSRCRWAQLLNWEDWSRKFKGRNRLGHRDSGIDVILVMSMYPALVKGSCHPTCECCTIWRLFASPAWQGVQCLETTVKGQLVPELQHLQDIFAMLDTWCYWSLSNLVSAHRCNVLDSLRRSFWSNLITGNLRIQI